MAVADEAATMMKTNLCTLDLVSFRQGSRKLADRGLVLFNADGEDDAYTILRVDGSLVTKNASDIGIFDRTLLYVGKIVESVSDYGGQIGVVTGVATTLGVVQLNDGLGATKAVSRVSPADLRRVRELSLGDYVVSGQWLGRVVEVTMDTEISFDDGAVCRVADAASRKIKPAKTHAYLPQTNTALYPGARVVINQEDSSAVFMEERWLSGQWKPDRAEGTVTKVEMADVLVYWIASAEQAGMESAPPANQNPDKLTLLCSAPECTWCFADRCFLNADHTDEQLSSSSLPVTMAVSLTCTSVEVLWQDGTRQTMARSAHVSPVEFASDLDFFPGQYVIDNSVADDDAIDAMAMGAASGSKRRVGVVKSLNSKEHMVKVSWFKAAETGPGGWEVECEDTVSAYELARDPDYSAFYGDVVVRLQSDVSESTPLAQKQAQALSWVGHVIDLHVDGHVQVKWGDGSTSTFGIFYGSVVPAFSPWLDGKAAAPAPPTANGASPHASVATAASPPSTAACRLHPDATAPHLPPPLKLLLPHRLLVPPLRLLVLPLVLPHEISVANNEHYTQLRAELTGSVEEDGVDAPADNDQHDPEDGTNVEEGMIQGGDGSGHVSAGSHEDPSVDGDATETIINAILDDDSVDDSTENVVNKADAHGDDDRSMFPHFDVVQTPPDHHYLDTMEQVSGGRKKWVKAVQKEWKILLNNLPDTIYVGAFEDRMDLLRAVMVGASGTPYQDGLFFFDLQMPPSYPAEPPQVYYHSFGLRLNPNLYESGTVCLSLLNTFGGDGTEVWSPAMSSVLQVLVSIQGLVLNDQPYYNEPTYETLVGTLAGRRNALPYGENAFLLNLRTMIYLLRRPPQGFEEFVKDHFRRRGRFVLATCVAWLQGCAIHTFVGDARDTAADNQRPCSVGLKLALTKLVSSLLAAFMEIGAEGCDDFQLQFQELKSL
ncbi:probable ubiquitin-conjugating enzyme E2 23 [Lolium rigidum]|uniref:probable ubiquitin-conjugating enzyme E2 23 n=1 Tax=Lolium rigidum TaxID=89674 RepID=UPI001F5C7377|nr:probable ubiquitin-conjugating enzyme E2 23 [Lolium rigidum]